MTSVMGPVLQSSLVKMKLPQENLEKISIGSEERMAGNDRNEKIDQAKNRSVTKLSIPQLSKEANSKCGVSLLGKSASYNRNSKHPLSKRKSIPIANHVTNASTKVVLFERDVQIKDLESKVRYLQNKIREVEVENKTLRDVQSRQERELKKFKEGVADIPSLLRSHKEETKVLESTIFTLRKELKDCQKELKTKNEVILKKDLHIDKQNSSLKRNEKYVQDISSEIKNIKITKLELEEENKKLLEYNQSLKFENEDLQKKIKEMVQKILKLEENQSEENNLNKQLTDEIAVLQKKYEDKQCNGSCAQQILMFDKETSYDPPIETSLTVLNPLSTETFLESENKGLEETSFLRELQDSSEQQVWMFDKKTSYNPPIETSFKILNPLSTETLLESENKGLEESSIVHELQNKSPEKAKDVGKAKEALIHTFKCYEKLCNDGLYRSAGKLSVGIMTNNVKSLPPLKQTMRRYSQTANSMLVKEQFFSSVDANLKIKERKKSLEGKKLLKDFHCRVNMCDTERVSENDENITVKIDKYNTFDRSPKQNSTYQKPGFWFEDL